MKTNKELVSILESLNNQIDSCLCDVEDCEHQIVLANNKYEEKLSKVKEDILFLADKHDKIIHEDYIDNIHLWQEKSMRDRVVKHYENKIENTNKRIESLIIKRDILMMIL